MSRKITGLLVGVVLALAAVATQPGAAAALTPAGGSWYWQNPLPQGNQLEDVTMVGARYGWAVGRGGVILKTANGGLTWTPQHADTNESFAHVSFVDELTGWAVTWSLTDGVFHTDDGGVTWVRQDVNESAHDPWLTSCDFVDGKNGWLAGQQPGIIYRTTDGGATWTPLDEEFDDIYDIDFIDARHGWAVGAGGLIWRTSDGGLTWKAAHVRLNNFLEAVQFVDWRHGWVAGSNGVVLRTGDGGRTWTRIRVPVRWCSFNAVAFTSPRHGWVAGCRPTAAGEWADARALVLHTSDAGRTWTVQRRGPQPEVLGLAAADSRHAVVVGRAGTILRSVDGVRWQPASAGFTGSVNGLAFADENRGWAVGGDDLVADTGGVVLHTADGGVTWREQKSAAPLLEAEDHYLIAVTCAGAATAWAVGGAGTIVHTADGGETWTDQTRAGLAGFDLTAVTFADAAHGWALGANDFQESSVILRTTDGGAHWGRTVWSDVTGLCDLDFVDARHGWAVGVGAPQEPGWLLRTRDGGQSWERLSVDYWDWGCKVDFVDETHGWVADGSCVWRTTDGGDTWESLSLAEKEYAYDLQFSDREHGWAAGGGAGHVIHTADGGETWQASVHLYFGTELRSVCALDDEHVWMSGDHGLIMFTTHDPVTNDDADGAWHNAPVEVRLAACDNSGSGIATTEHWVDAEGAWSAGSLVTVPAPADHGNDGVHVVGYRSADVAGHLEPTRLCRVRIDTTGPTTRALASVRVRSGASARFRYRVDDALSSEATAAVCICTRDGRLVKRTAARRVATGRALSRRVHCDLRRGRYTFSVSATDLAGNTQTAVVSGRLVVE